MFNTLLQYRLWGLLILLLASGVSLLCQDIHIQNSFLELLPVSEDEGGAAFDRIARAGGRQVNLLTEGKSEQEVLQRMRKLCAALPEGVHPAISKTTLSDLAGALRPFRFQFLSARHRELLEKKQFDSLYEEGMSNMYGFISANFYPVDEDPYAFAFTFLMESPLLKRGGFEPADDVMVAQRGDAWYAYVPLLLPESVQDSLADLAHSLEPLVKLCREAGVQISGTPVHTYLAASSASSAISWLGIFSTVLVVVVFLWVFSSLRSLLIMALTVACGALTSIGAVVLLHGQVHILALVFGCSLVGISTDYTVHYLVAHHADTDACVGRGLARSLLLGLVTTCLGYAMFYTAGITLLGQIATVSLVGLCTAMLVIFAFYPLLFAGHMPIKIAPAVLRAADKTQRCRRIRGYVPWVAAAALGAIAACGLSVSDDLRGFYKPGAELLNAERKLAELNGMEHGICVLLVRGESAEQVLQRQEELLERMQADGVPSTCVAAMVPSARRQQQNFELVQQLAARYAEELPLDMPKWPGALTPEQLFASCPSFAYLSSLWGERCGTVLVPGAYRDKLSAYTGEHIIQADRFAELEAHIKLWRERLTWQLVGMLLLGFLLQICFFGVRAAVLISGVPLAGVLSVPAGLALLGQPLSLFHVLACFMVAGLGYDYSIFRANQPRNTLTTIAVALSFFTTLTMFGVLAFTSFSVTHDMGLAICLGLTVSYVLSTAATGAAAPPCKASCETTR